MPLSLTCSTSQTRYNMLDAAYITLTVFFFALMLAYVRGCDALGRRQDAEDRTP